MKNSYYSNLNTSKLSTKLIEDTCLEHDGEPYTNFCSASTCIKPLCPQCIQNHYNHHKNIRTSPEIDSFKTLKNKCVSKIADILEHIGQQSDTSPNELLNIFEASIKRVKQVKDQCRKILDSYFLNLEQFIKKKMSKLTSQQSELIVEANRVNNIIAELRLLINKLENNRSFLNTAQTIIKLDGDKIENKVKEGVQTIIRFKENHKTNLYIQKNFQHKFTTFLGNTFFYGNKDNLQTMPKIADQIKSKTAMENLSRSHSRSKEDMTISKQPRYQKKSSLRENQFESGQSYERKRQEDERSNLSRKSSKKNFKKAGKEIIGMNTFSNNSPRRYLHFFQHDQNLLHYLDLDGGSEFQTINLNVNFKLPDFHKSISVSNGDLYLVAGADSSTPQKKIPNIYKYDFQANNLQLVNKLKYGRSSHSICFNNRYIYVLGGYLNNQFLTNRCERYDIVSNRVEELRPMHYASCSFACCSFSGRYIYKIGGLGENNEIIHNIERFDEKTGMWEEVNPSLDIAKGEQLQALSTSAAIQITKQEIMVVGGYDQNNTGYKQTYILKIEDSGQTSIRDLNTYPLPVAEAFWNNNPVIHQKIVFALQNVSTGENDCSQSVRRILSFDGREWKQL